MFGWIKRRKETQRLTNLFDSAQWYWWYKGPYSKPRPNTDEILERILASRGFDLALGVSLDSHVKLMMTLPKATPPIPTEPRSLTLSEFDWMTLYATRCYFELRSSSIAIQFSGGAIVPEAALMMIDYVKRGEVEPTYIGESNEEFYDHLLSRTVFLAGIEWHRVDTFDFLQPLLEMNTPDSLAELQNLWQTEFLLYPERAARWKSLLPTQAHQSWLASILEAADEARKAESDTFRVPRFSTYAVATIVEEDEEDPSNFVFVFNPRESGDEEPPNTGFESWVWARQGTWERSCEPVDLSAYQ